LWAGGDATGSITVKNIYAALQQQLNSGVEIPWIQQIWNWKVPLKLKLFTWLVGKERILTWDALQRRGWEGPGICLLCNNAPEDLHHLLIHCPFTKEVWYRSIKHFSLPIAWSGSSITDCFSLWSTQKSAPPSLAVHICWQIWLERNRVIFEDRLPSLPAVFHKILVSFNWQPSTVQCFPLKLLNLNWRRVTPLLFSTVLLSQVAFVVGLEAPSKTTRQESQSGSSTVELVQIQKPSSWVYGPHSLSLPFGLSTTYTSMATRELLLTG
jgi:hypothetical protein